MMDNENVYVQVTVVLPWHSEPIRQGFKVGRFEAECLHPLPRERELAFMPAAQAKARKMSERRRDVIEYISQNLAAGIAKAIESRDPQHGYSPEEWAQMNAPKKS